MERREKHDFTYGPIYKELLMFAWPLLLSNLLQLFYNTADLIFSERALGQSVSSAIGLSTLLVNCLIMFFSGMSIGTGVVISRAYGKKDKTQLENAVQNAMIISVLGGIILMAMGYIFSPYYLRIIETPHNLYNDAMNYLHAYFLSFIPSFIYNIGSGILRAMGSITLPLFSQIAGCITHAIFGSLFVFVFDVKTSGIGYISLISQSVVALIILWGLRKFTAPCIIHIRHINLDATIIKRIIRIGVPTGIQSLIISLSNVLAQYQINSLGENAIAAFTAYFKIEQIIYLPIIALGQAIMIFVSQNMGAGSSDRIKSGIQKSMKLGILTISGLSFISLFLSPVLFRFFYNDLCIIDLGLSIASITFPFYVFYLILQILGDSLRGGGIVHIPTIISIANFCILRISLLFVLVPRHPSVKTVAITYPITWAATACCIAIYFLYKKTIFSEKETI